MSLYRCCNKLASADDVRVLSGQSGRDVIATSRLDVETETEMFFRDVAYSHSMCFEAAARLGSTLIPLTQRWRCEGSG